LSVRFERCSAGTTRWRRCSAVFQWSGDRERSSVADDTSYRLAPRRVCTLKFTRSRPQPHKILGACDSRREGQLTLSETPATSADGSLLAVAVGGDSIPGDHESSLLKPGSSGAAIRIAEFYQYRFPPLPGCARLRRLMLAYGCAWRICQRVRLVWLRLTRQEADLCERTCP
jgi:hypothetical protein